MQKNELFLIKIEKKHQKVWYYEIFSRIFVLQSGAVVARRAHNPKAAGSSPVSASKHKCKI